MKEDELSIIDQIIRYIKSNGDHKIKISSESKFRFENIEECIKAFIILDRSANYLKFQEAFYLSPIEFVKDSGLIEVPSNIEILNKCKNSYKKEHTDKCFECKFNKNGNANTMMTVCMNRSLYETLFNIIVESDLPKKILFSADLNFKKESGLEMIGETMKVIAANAQESGAVVDICVVNGITVIEVPDI
jgi:hypothetical protein